MNELKISLDELKKKNIIYINNIMDGFHKYPNSTIEGTEEEVNNLVRNIVKLNGLENSYADFYYGRLDNEAKDKVKERLNKKEIEFIESLNLDKDNIYLRLNIELLQILLKLTSNEILFSSFYFTKYPCTVWGNYGNKYPIFFKDERVMKIILEEISAK